jgi:hypothetical protein
MHAITSNKLFFNTLDTGINKPSKFVKRGGKKTTIHEPSMIRVTLGRLGFKELAEADNCSLEF